MRFILLNILTLVLSYSGVTQNTTNPFEIQSRLDSVYQSEKNPESSTQNVFDVVRSQKDRLSSPELTVKDTLLSEQESDIIPEVWEDTGEEPKEEINANVNPFDVSHIPVRKSKLKMEANALNRNPSNRTINNESGDSNVFLFWLMLLTGLILAIVINTQKGAITKIAKAITNENVLKLNYREEKKGINGHYILLYFSFFLNTAIFIYLYCFNFQNQHGWIIYQSIFLGLLGLYLIRHIFLSSIGRGFPIRKESNLWGFTIETFNIFVGLLLIPFNLIIAFGPESIAKPLILFAAAIVGLLLVLRTFRGLLIASSYVQSNLFHFLLYLCTFEILPITLLIKAIGNFGNA